MSDKNNEAKPEDQQLVAQNDGKTKNQAGEALQEGGSLLGLSTTALAGLTEADLVGNQVAIRMLLHYYKQLVDETASLKNERNTLRTYVAAYDKERTNSAVGGILLTISNVVVGFGVNILTGGTAVAAGWCTLGAGVVIAAGGMYFSFVRGTK